MTDASGAKRRSVAFIESVGDALTCSRVHALVGAQPVDSVIERLPASAVEPNIGVLMTTLAVFDDLGCRDVTPVEVACEVLTRTQGRDGSWCESVDATDDERIFTTGMIAGYLAKTPFVRKSPLDLAAEYLGSHWAPDRVKGAAWRATAAYFHCFSLVQHDQSDAILQWCGRELERGFRTGIYDVVEIARVFTLCRAHALPGSQLAVADLTERLVDEQRDDGSYIPRDDSSVNARVAHTLHALVAMVRFG